MQSSSDVISNNATDPDALYSPLMNMYDEEVADTDKSIIKHVLDNISVENNRIVVPALWDDSVIHKLPNNFWLAYNLLHSVRKKLDMERLEQYDSVIIQQLQDGILVQSSPVADLKRDKNASFIAHNAVFKPEAESTKCRVVLLSNLCEKGSGDNLSHNQVSIPGPQLNNKIVTTCTLYRFNKFLLVYDIEKAFLQLGLKPDDSNKLNILWFKDIKNGNYDLVAYKFNRLPFGLRFSPFLLMISLYYVLLVNCNHNDEDVTRMLFNLCYMDNLAFSASERHLVKKAYETSNRIFGQFSFNLQKIEVNDSVLREELGLTATPNTSTNLLGLKWDTTTDELSNSPVFLNPSADCKREVLSTINANYDPLGIHIPLLIRAKLFLRKLQSDENLKWDTKLNAELRNEWRNIAIQANNGIRICVPRYVGEYKGEFTLVVFTDASNDFIGTVLYLLDNETQKLSFILSKNRLVSKGMKSKTIPVLELLGIKFGVQTLLKMNKELTEAFCPLNITGLKLYSDSMISLQWISSKVRKLNKVEKKGNQINSILDSIVKLVEAHPIRFSHVPGASNPADMVTKPVSSKLLVQSIFLHGPVLSNCSEPYVCIPNVDLQASCAAVSVEAKPCPVDFEKYSSFSFAAKVYHYVCKYVRALKSKVLKRNDQAPIEVSYTTSVEEVIKTSQQQWFPEVFSFFAGRHTHTDPIITQLNLFIDEKGIIRVKSKMRNLKANYSAKYPILMHKKSNLTQALIRDYHLRMRHAGVYKLLAELNKEFYVSSAYSTVKRVLQQCLVCRKLHNRSIKCIQNDYKDFRINPQAFPFRDIAIDHMGPFSVKSEGGTAIKAYVLIVTCLWSRAVNLLVAQHIDKLSFLLCFQEHIFEYGIPQTIVSDNGSPICSSLNDISCYLNDDQVKSFLKEKNIKMMQFLPYPANASFLGGFVENLVKQVKLMINSSIARRSLPFDQFNLFIKECKMLINKRPTAYKRLLTDQSSHEDFEVITPELLIYGHEIPAISVVPHLDSELADSFNPEQDNSSKTLVKRLENLRAAKREVAQRYYNEFVSSLRDMSTDRPDRYRMRHPPTLAKGDLVAVKQNFCKPYNYPLGIIQDVEFNDVCDVVAVKIRKANREVIRRHVSDVILIEQTTDELSDQLVAVEESLPPQRPQRQAAAKGGEATTALFRSGLA